MGKSQDTISRIILNARTLFWERGYKKVTMQEIADRSKITKGLLTHYFPKKKDILKEINLRQFNDIYKLVEGYSDGDPLLQYIMTTYLMRKAQYSLPETLRIFKETFISEGSETVYPYTTYSELYIEILKFLNVNMTIEELYPRTIMGQGAQRELAYVYMNNLAEMDFEAYLKNTVMIACLMLEIPAIIRNQYYNMAMKIIERENLSVVDYIAGKTAISDK